MALINEEGNYLKISRIYGDLIQKDDLFFTYSIYKDENTRLNPQWFDNIIEKTIKPNIDIIDEENDREKNKDKIICNCYVYLKNNGFEEWVDLL